MADVKRIHEESCPSPLARRNPKHQPDIIIEAPKSKPKVIKRRGAHLIPR